MNKFYNTISEISRIFTKNNIEFVVTRFNRNSIKEPDDLDILVKPNSFKKTIKVLEENGFRSSSHDEALGGRIKGMQVNLIKPSRIKIDLHQNFTWRATRYLDLGLIWGNLETKSVAGVKCIAPQKGVDAFLVMVNIIFEKTYLNKNDFRYINEDLDNISRNLIFEEQAKNYGWGKTFQRFKKWFKRIRSQESFPVFLPPGLVLYSYWEKFLQEKKINPIGFLYYCFFRIRFAVSGVLPYE